MTRKTDKRQKPVLDEAAGRSKCLRLLGIRARSAAELRQRLARAGFEQGVRDKVLADLEQAGLIDDEEFARSWLVSRKAAGGIGRRRLAAELRRKGVSAEIVKRTLAEGTDEETELQEAVTLTRNRLRGRPLEAQAVPRLRRFLLGRGFEFDTVDDVLQTLARQGDLIR